ncbi:MAG: response regulator [Clostridia bacterium]|nr:response regulator [Clostridia bacterium]
MKVLLIDKNLEDLKLFETECTGLPDFEIAASFSDSSKALEFASNSPVDLVLLDTVLPDIDGFTLAKKLREINKNIIIIFVTANTSHAAEALKMKADYVVFKPYAKEDVTDALTRARYLKPRLEKHIKANLFGKFDLYVNGKRVIFPTKKAKELAALCISQRGGTVSTYEIIEKLWVGSKFKRASETSGYRKAIKSMLETFKEYNIDYIFERKYGFCRIAPEDIECDYYSLLDYDNVAVKTYGGAVMPEYTWAKELKKRADDIAGMLK